MQAPKRDVPGGATTTDAKRPRTDDTAPPSTVANGMRLTIGDGEGEPQTHVMRRQTPFQRLAQAFVDSKDEPITHFRFFVDDKRVTNLGLPLETVMHHARSVHVQHIGPPIK